MLHLFNGHLANQHSFIKLKFLASYDGFVSNVTTFFEYVTQICCTCLMDIWLISTLKSNFKLHVMALCQIICASIIHSRKKFYHLENLFQLQRFSLIR